MTVADWSRDKALLRMTSLLGEDALIPVALAAQETISKPFMFDMDVVSRKGTVTADKLLYQPVCVTLAAAAMQDSTQVTEALARPEGAGYLTEATRVAAHALPKREAVRWACMCAGHSAPADLPAADRVAREAAEDWVRQQTNRTRRIAWDRAQAAGSGMPKAWTSIAAFWSGDSISPEGQPAVRPAAPICRHCRRRLGGAYAQVRGDVTRREERLRRFLESGRNIATAAPAGCLPRRHDARTGGRPATRLTPCN